MPRAPPSSHRPGHGAAPSAASATTFARKLGLIDAQRIFWRSPFFRPLERGRLPLFPDKLARRLNAGAAMVFNSRGFV